MNNELLSLFPAKNKANGDKDYGILLTPCFPAQYYYGPLYNRGQIDWWPADNDTNNFHRTLEQAEGAALKHQCNTNFI